MQKWSILYQHQEKHNYLVMFTTTEEKRQRYTKNPFESKTYPKNNRSSKHKRLPKNCCERNNTKVPAKQ